MTNKDQSDRYYSSENTRIKREVGTPKPTHRRDHPEEVILLASEESDLYMPTISESEGAPKRKVHEIITIDSDLDDGGCAASKYVKLEPIVTGIVRETRDYTDVKHEHPIQTGSRQPTTEQRQIVRFGESLRRNEPKIIRVFAGAGTGKTTTLHLLADVLLKARHSVLYLVYNKVCPYDSGCTDGSDTEV
jgi:hypothetical protein